MNEIVAATLSLPAVCDALNKQKKVKGKAELIRTYRAFAGLAAQYCVKHDLCKDTPEAREYLDKLLNETVVVAVEQSISCPSHFTCHELYINCHNEPDMRSYVFRLSEDGQIYAYIKSLDKFIPISKQLSPVLRDAVIFDN